jgi:hypothetical protein
MDLVTLVTACALGAEPKLMHALVWHQSGGEPWAVSVQSEPNPRVYSSMQEAIRETRASSAGSGTVRVGLAGLAVDPSKVAPAVFLPCRNVAIAAGQIAKLADRCKAHPRLKTDSTFCAVAVYRGSWRRPDVKFADAVATSVAKGDAPDFDMPKDTTIEFLDTASETAPRSDDPVPGSVSAAEERERGWSARCSRRSRGRPQASRATVRVTIQLQRKCRHLACPMRSRRQSSHQSTACSCRDRSIGGRSDWRARSSQEFARHRGNGDKAEWERPTGRAMAR